MIEIKSLCKTFSTKNQKIEALNNINLSVKDGEIFGIIGLSGAGKSTLVRCINLLEKPDSGSVIIDGRDITKLKEKELLKLRASIGMIFQNFNLLEQRNVLKNVCYPLEIAGVKNEEAKKRALELLEVVGLSEKSRAYPSQLSGGQKQRVAIARALATNPKYILCDEATSALDPNTTASILSLLKEINEKMGVTIIVITHEMSVIERICDSVAVIDSGKIAETGRVCDIFSSPKSDTAKQLILPKIGRFDDDSGQNRLRLVFNGNSSSKPILSSLILECQVAVNILYADTKEIDDLAYGHMIIALPDDREAEERVISWLNENGVEYEWEGK